LQALATLAAIVISGVVSLVDYSEAIYLWRVHKFDFSVWMCAFLGTLFLGVEMGLGLSVGISLLLVIFESAYPHTAVLGRLPGTHHYRNIKQYPNAERYDGTVLIRVDAPIYFANTQHVKEKIQKYYERAEEKLHEEHRRHSESNNNDESDENNNVIRSSEVQRVQFVVLELSPVSHIDTSALHTLHEIKALFCDDNVQLCLANPNPRVMQRLVHSGFADEIGSDHIFVALHDAVHYCLNHMDNVEIEKHLSQMSLNKLNEQNNDVDYGMPSSTEHSNGDLGLNV
jgi:sulfate transporter 4